MVIENLKKISEKASKDPECNYMHITFSGPGMMGSGNWITSKNSPED